MRILEDSLLAALPLEDPIVIFAVTMAVFFGAPLVFERYHLPGIVGVIVLGTVFGPNGLGLLDRSETFVLLGEVGLVYLMFLAGLEVDLGEFVENRDRSLVFGALSFLLPQGLGMVTGIYLLGLDFAPAALYAAIFSSHTLMAYPVVDRLGIVKNEAMTATIGGTIFTDTAALLVLSVVIGAVEGELTLGFWASLTAGLLVLFSGVWVLVPRIGRWFFRNVSEESYFEFLFVMAILFASAVLAEVAGVKHIIGAFLAGLALNRLVPGTGTLMNRIEFVGNALFIPFFLFSVGMLVDPGVLFEGFQTVVVAGSIVGLVVVTKLVASAATGQLYEYTMDERLTMFGLSVGQAAAALAIVQIGFDEGIPGFDQHMINGVVVMILVVSILSPALTERFGRRIVDAEEDAEYDPGEEPLRVLVPVEGDGDAIERLLDFGMLVRETAGEDEPLRVLRVVDRQMTRLTARRGDDEADSETAGAVSDAESELEHAEEYVSGAEVPVETMTRVDSSVVGGITTAITDERITAVVVGWRRARSFGDRLFGSVVDQLLERTTQLVMVSRFTEPVNVAERVVCVLPGRIAAHPGFSEAAHTVKVVANELGVEVVWFVVDGDAERYGRLIEAIEPEANSTVEAVSNGGRLREALEEHVTDTDLVFGFSPRRGARGWEPWLRTLPSRLEGLDAPNAVFVYPAEGDSAGRSRFLDMR